MTVVETKRPKVSRSAALVGLVSLALVAAALVAVNRGQRPVDIEGMNEDDAQATRLVNEYRTGLALPGLSDDPGLDAEARDWAEHLADTGTLTHDALSLDGWSEVGENVGRGATIEIVEQAFEDSATHEHNLSGDYSHLGVAVAVRDKVTWIVQRFGSKAAPPTSMVPPPTVTLVPATTVTLAPPVLCRRAEP